MKKFVFFCIPAHGHTNPTLGVVRELVNRGHQVWYYSYNMLRRKIEETGATFVSCDDYDMERRIDPKDAARVGKDLAFSTKILVDTTLALDEKVCRDMQQLQPDCIVADSMAVWGKAVAMKLGIPFVSSTTTFAFNRYSAKIMPRGAGEILSMILAMPKVTRQIKRLQSHGYPIRNILDILQNDDKTHTVVYTSQSFQPCGDTFSARHYAFVGPSIRLVEQPMEKTKEKLVYVSMGTVNNDMLPFYQSCIAALKELNCQLILSVGTQVDPGAFGELPGNCSVFQQVDQIAVLQKADVFVTHCGMNSVNEALYFGVPLVMHPVTTEQKGVANRVAELKAGVFLQKETPQAVAAAVRQVLQNSDFSENARHIGEDFRRCAGAAGAAEKILSRCN